MARGITENDVFTACDALLLAGDRPTIERVRQKIGRGSPNTVSPMLDAWFKGLGRRLQDPGVFAAPPDVPEPIAQAAHHFWEIAQAEARRDVDVRVQAGLVDAIAHVDTEKQRTAIAEASAAEADARVASLRVELGQLHAALASERTGHRSTETKLESALDRCAALQSEVIQGRQAVADERTRSERAIAVADERGAGAERRAAMEIERERALRTRAEKAAENIAKRFEATLKEQISATEQLSVAQDRLTQLRKEAHQREQQLDAAVKHQEDRVQELEASLFEVKLARERAEAHSQAVQATIDRFKPLFGRTQPARAGSKKSAPT